MTNYIGIDIGGTAIKSSLLNQAGAISQTTERQHPKTLAGFTSCIYSIQASFANISTVGIALSMLGVIVSSTGHAVHGENLKFIRGCNYS